MSRLLIAVCLVLTCAAPAQAETRVVATSGDFELRARQAAGRLCMTLTRAGRYRGEVCGRIPRSPHRPLRMFADLAFDTYVAAVPPWVRVVEAERSRGRRQRHRTAGARGFSARFVLLPAPPRTGLVRFLRADGVLLGVDFGTAGFITFDNQTQIWGEREDGVRAHTELSLAPTPEDPGRLKTLACVDVVHGAGGKGFCDHGGENGLVVQDECDGVALVGGIVAADVAGVRLTLGSGAQRTIPSLALPAAFGGRRVIGAPAPSGEAIRAAAVLDAAGAVVARGAVGLPPGGQPCNGEDQGTDGFGGVLAPASPPSGAVTVASAGGRALLAADQGETLCVGLETLPARVCPPPPVDSDRPRLMRRGRTVAGVLSRDAARVTLRLDRGEMTIRTTAGLPYTGRWAGDVRFFAATVGADREVTGAVVRDAGGRIIGISERGVPRRTIRRVVLAQRAGRGAQLVTRAGDPPCLAAFATRLPPATMRFCTRLGPGGAGDGPFLPYSGAVVVPCAPRRALAYGRMPDGSPTPRVLLEGRRSVKARAISLRGEDAWIAFLPDATVRGLRAGRQRAALRLPPASAQCGYSATRQF